MLKDLVGLNNGYFKVLNYVGLSLDKRKRRLWNCECICFKNIILTTDQFNKKIPRSCGCYKQIRKGNKDKHYITHGLSRNKKIHPVFRIWKNIKTRCYGKKYIHSNKAYKDITMLEEWKNDSKSFIDWAFSNGWKQGLCIDRIDPKKGYFPENCQFITKSENAKKVFRDNPELREKYRKRIIEYNKKKNPNILQNGSGG